MKFAESCKKNIEKDEQLKKLIEDRIYYRQASVSSLKHRKLEEIEAKKLLT